MYQLTYEDLKWASLISDDFLIGPNNSSLIQNIEFKKFFNFSRGLEENLIVHSINEKCIPYLGKVQSILYRILSGNYTNVRYATSGCLGNRLMEDSWF